MTDGTRYRVYTAGGEARMFAVGYGVLGGGYLPPADDGATLSADDAKRLCGEINAQSCARKFDFPWRRKSA